MDEEYHSSCIAHPLKIEATHTHDDNDTTTTLMIQSPSIPFVLSFSNLSYSIKNNIRCSLYSYIGHLFNRCCCCPVAVTTNHQATGTGSFFSVSDSKSSILDNISGSARSGEITAVLGASGSGKSTLIDALTNRIAKGSLKGTVTLNGNSNIDSRLLKAISAYVMQDDLLFPMLTVEETLMFAAEFRIPRSSHTTTLISMNMKSKQARVSHLIDQLGLRAAAKTIIGDEGHHGISGGERRRVSIGIDIIHDPILLFLDEPTSGLDSTSAFTVVKVLQRIAKTSGSVVFMSVHQPSYRILELLDSVIFLSKGQAVYNGPLGMLPEFLSQFGCSINNHNNMIKDNWAEFTLDLIRQLEESPEGTRNLVEFNNKWQHTINLNVNQTTQQQQYYCHQSLKEAITARRSPSIMGKEAIIDTPNSSRPLMMTNNISNFANPFWTEIMVLSKRSLINSRRTPKQFGVRLGTALALAFVLASVYCHLDDSPAGAKKRFSFFALTVSFPFYNTVDTLPILLQERYILIRDTAHNTYRRSSYVLSHLITSLPGILFISVSFTICTYWTVGLDGDFFFYFLILFASFWAGNSFVSFLSSLVPDVNIGNTVVVAALALFLVFCGFFVSRDQIPRYWLWLHYISLLKYPFEAILLNEFQDPTKCFMKGINIFDNTVLAAMPYAMKLKLLNLVSSDNSFGLGMTITPSSCVTTGVDVLARLGVAGEFNKWNCLWITVAWGFL